MQGSGWTMRIHALSLKPCAVLSARPMQARKLPTGCGPMLCIFAVVDINTLQEVTEGNRTKENR